MEEKKERILIDILPPACGFGSCGCFYTEGVGEYFCCCNGEKEPITEEICNNCPYDNSIPLQDAIKRMANVIRKKLFNNEGPTQKIKEEGLEQEYNRYVDVMCECIAEAALNALLEGKK